MNSNTKNFDLVASVDNASNTNFDANANLNCTVVTVQSRPVEGLRAGNRITLVVRYYKRYAIYVDEL